MRIVFTAFSTSSGRAFGTGAPGAVQGGKECGRSPTGSGRSRGSAARASSAARDARPLDRRRRGVRLDGARSPMSLKRDYILRIVEQLALALASVLRLRKKGAHDEAIAEVASAAAGIAGLDLRMAASVDAATLSTHVPEPPRLAALARLLLERAEIAREQGDAGELAWRRKAVEVWLEAGARG